MRYQFQSLFDQGAVRPNNEDAIQYGTADDANLAWIVIADGMGGHLAGEVASKLLTDEIEFAINQIERFDDIDWLCWIEIALNRANNKIFIESKNDPEKKGMGTTAVVAIIIKNRCYIGWVGDSRCYIYSNSESSLPKLAQLSVDHTMVQVLLDKGAITEKEAAEANNKNMLSKAIGIKKGIDVDTKQVTVQEGDILLLSTDGLHDSLSPESLADSVKKIALGKNIENELLEKAIQGGSKDNITFASLFIKKS